MAVSVSSKTSGEVEIREDTEGIFREWRQQIKAQLLVCPLTGKVPGDQHWEMMSWSKSNLLVVLRCQKQTVQTRLSLVHRSVLFVLFQMKTWKDRLDIKSYKKGNGKEQFLGKIF